MRPAIKGMPLLQLGEAHFRVGEISEARAKATRAVAICEEAGERAHEAWSRLLLWQCACLDGRGDQDESSWRTLAQAQLNPYRSEYFKSLKPCSQGPSECSLSGRVVAFG
jgi:hypothetical protein